jgi:nitrate reductase beta subunit
LAYSNRAKKLKQVRTRVVDVDESKIRLLIELWEKYQNLSLYEIQHDFFDFENLLYVSKIVNPLGKSKFFLMNGDSYEKLYVNPNFVQRLFRINHRHHDLVDKIMNKQILKEFEMTKTLYLAWKDYLNL